MKVWIEVTFDIETGNVSRETFYEYEGPLALCDRSLQAQANQAEKSAAGTAANYGAEGAGIQSSLVPRLEQQAINPMGYGSGLGAMETSALQTGAGATGAAQEQARLQAMRTGNAAGLGAITAASAGEGARGTGGALQSILAKNAELKARQQQEANTGLQGILGEDVRGQVANAGLVPENINAGVNAGKSGWFQNLMEYMKTASNAAAGAGGG